MANEKRLIDVNAVIKKIDEYYHDSPFPHPGTTWLRGLELAVVLLLNAPTVDAVEVVRCKDCKWYENGKSYDAYCNHPTDGMNYSAEDDFCSYGERKDNV